MDFSRVSEQSLRTSRLYQRAGSSLMWVGGGLDPPTRFSIPIFMQRGAPKGHAASCKIAIDALIDKIVSAME